MAMVHGGMCSRHASTIYMQMEPECSRKVAFFPVYATVFEKFHLGRFQKFAFSVAPSTVVMSTDYQNTSFTTSLENTVIYFAFSLS